MWRVIICEVASLTENNIQRTSWPQLFPRVEYSITALTSSCCRRCIAGTSDFLILELDEVKTFCIVLCSRRVSDPWNRPAEMMIPFLLPPSFIPFSHSRDLEMDEARSCATGGNYVRFTDASAGSVSQMLNNGSCILLKVYGKCRTWRVTAPVLLLFLCNTSAGELHRGIEFSSQLYKHLILSNSSMLTSNLSI